MTAAALQGLAAEKRMRWRHLCRQRSKYVARKKTHFFSVSQNCRSWTKSLDNSGI
jgi:hypothetical protein